MVEKKKIALKIKEKIYVIVLNFLQYLKKVF